MCFLPLPPPGVRSGLALETAGPLGEVQQSEMEGVVGGVGEKEGEAAPASWGCRAAG